MATLIPLYCGLQIRFCLFPLLTALWLQGFGQANHAQPDTLRPRNRFGLGLAYTSGPRAYGSKGFFGPQVTYTFGKGKWEANAFVGGYYSYNEDGQYSLKVEVADVLGGTAPSWIVYQTTRGLQAQLGISRFYRLNRKFTMGIGIQGGWSVVQRKVNFKTIPLQIQPHNSQDSGNFIFYDVKDRRQFHHTFLVPTITFSFKMTERLSFSLVGGYGAFLMSNNLDKNETVAYMIKKPYNRVSPDDKNYPFNFSNNSIVYYGKSISWNLGKLRKESNLFGFSYIKFEVNFYLTKKIK